MIRILFLVLALSIPFAAAEAQSRQSNPGRMIFDFSGDSTLLGDPRVPAEEGTRLFIEYQGRLTMGLLMGEPVIMVKMKYDIIGGSITIPTMEPGQERYETIGLDQIPTIARDKIGIHEMKMMFHFATSGAEDVRILEDGGAFLRAGEYGFNMPGSPLWDEVFVISMGDFTDRGVEYMGAERAKGFWRQGLSLTSTEIHDALINLYDLHAWWAKNNTIPEYKATMRAVERLRDGIQVSYGYKNFLPSLFEGRPEQDMAYDLARQGKNNSEAVRFTFDSWFDKFFWTRAQARENYFEEYGAALEYARIALEKLRKLPPNLRIGDNHAPYRQAVADARNLVEEVRDIRAAFRPEGVDPQTLPRGAEQQMDGVYQVARIDGQRWLTEQGTDRQIREMTPDMFLIQESLVVVASALDRRYPCENGKISIPGIDPVTWEAETFFEFDCRKGWAYLFAIPEKGTDKKDAIISHFQIRIFDGARRTFNPSPPKACQQKFMKTAEIDGRSYRLNVYMEIVEDLGSVTFEEGNWAGTVLCLRRG